MRLCVQGSLDDDCVAQVCLLQTEFYLVELSGGKGRCQDERGAGPLAACHEILNIADPVLKQADRRREINK